MSERADIGAATEARAFGWAGASALSDEAGSLLNTRVLIMIDMNIGPSLRLANRHYVFEKGRVVWSGSSAALRAQPQVLHECLRNLKESEHVCT